MSSSGIIYQPRQDATPETELSALAAVYKLVLSKKADEPAPKPDGSDDHERLANKKGGQRDLREDAFLGAEGDRTEQTRKDKRDFVHR